MLRQLDAAAPGQGFAEAACWWSFTSSQGFAPGTYNVRLFFWNETAVDDEGMRRWGEATNTAAGCRLVDTALFNAAQPHYVVPPSPATFLTHCRAAPASSAGRTTQCRSSS